MAGADELVYALGVWHEGQGASVVARAGSSPLRCLLEAETDSDGEDAKDCGAPRETALMRIVEAGWFQKMVSGAIIANTLLMAFEADNPRMRGMLTLNTAFCLFFFVELSLRLGAYGRSFFINEEKGWNIFDFVVVCMVFANPVGKLIYRGGGRGGSLVMLLRIGRFARMARLLRTVRLLRNSRAKFVLDGIRQSLAPTFFATVVFSVITFMYAIAIVNVVKDFPDVEEVDDDGNPARDTVVKRFGTIPRALSTLFGWLTFDDWSYCARIINSVYPWMEFVWISFMMLGSFTFLSLITGIMADSLNEAREASEVVSSEIRVSELVLALEKQFEAADVGQDSLVDLEEFKRLVCHEEVQLKMEEYEVSLEDHEIVALFHNFDTDGSGRLSRTEFVRGFTKIITDRTVQDVMILEGNIRRVEGLIRHARSRRGLKSSTWTERVSKMLDRAGIVRTRMLFLENEVAELLRIAEFGVLA